MHQGGASRRKEIAAAFKGGLAVAAVALSALDRAGSKEDSMAFRANDLPGMSVRRPYLAAVLNLADVLPVRPYFAASALLGAAPTR